MQGLRHGALRKPQGYLTPGHRTWGPPTWWFAPGFGTPRRSLECSLACPTAGPTATVEAGGGGGVGLGWHRASVSDCLPLAPPIGLSPLLILTPVGPNVFWLFWRGAPPFVSNYSKNTPGGRGATLLLTFFRFKHQAALLLQISSHLRWCIVCMPLALGKKSGSR